MDATFHPSLDYVSQYLKSKKPELVGIYFSTLMYEKARLIAQIAKKTGAIVVGGGPHATISPESVIDDVDITVLGEGEETLRELAMILPSLDLSQIKGIWYKDGQGNVRKTPPRDVMVNLDYIGFPALDLVEMERYFLYWHYLDIMTFSARGINIMSSRGCPFSCTFCQPTLKKLFGDKVRYKSPDYLAEEITYYMHTFNVNMFFFHDDTFAADKTWANSFFDMLEKRRLNIVWGCNTRVNNMDESMMRRMYEVGCRVIHFGIESGSQRVLDEIYAKRITLDHVNKVIEIAKRVGMYSSGFFILGAPGETKMEMNKTIKLALSSGLNEAAFSIATPLPGTMLYDMIKNDRNFTISKDYSDFDYYRGLSYADHNSRNRQLILAQRKALFLFYLHPLRLQYILRHFFSFRGMVKLYIKIRRFF